MHRPPAAQLHGLGVLEDRKSFASALKEIYRAVDADAADKLEDWRRYTTRTAHMAQSGTRP
ncbi:hypothetical protein X734_33175 [Mesorhizobium sp. L2C084A000]|nr:hypothetical protein X734_33175 [Mesorhizobium sp. L2C084A000]